MHLFSFISIITHSYSLCNDPGIFRRKNTGNVLVYEPCLRQNNTFSSKPIETDIQTTLYQATFHFKIYTNDPEFLEYSNASQTWLRNRYMQKVFVCTLYNNFEKQQRTKQKQKWCITNNGYTQTNVTYS